MLWGKAAGHEYAVVGCWLGVKTVMLFRLDSIPGLSVTLCLKWDKSPG